MINNHTRVECRVLCILARGGKIAEVAGRSGTPIFDTGVKRNNVGQTKAEFFAAHGLNRGADGTPTAKRGDFIGATIAMERDLFDRLIGAGLVTKKGAITAAGRAYYREVHAGATRVMECVGHDDVDITQAFFTAGDAEHISHMLRDETDDEELDAVLAETGFGGRRGLSIAGCCQGAAVMRTIVDRFAPVEGS